MRRPERVFRGRVAVDGVIIDVPTVGLERARRRVLEGFPDEVLHQLADGRWLIELSAARCSDPVGIGGLALAERAGAFVAAPGLPAESDHVVEFWHGDVVARRVRDLTPVDVSGWFDLGFEVRLDPLAPSTKRVPTEPERREPTPSRRRFKVGDRTSKSKRVAQELADEAARPRRPSRRGGRSGTASPQRTSRLRQAAVRGALKTPVKNVVGRRHARYLEDLTLRFELGQFDEALRRAIPAGGTDSSGGLTLRLPGRRQSLRWTTNAGGGTIPWGPSVGEHLSAVYRQAASRLEAAGDVDKAAFVLIELLRDRGAGAALLERHGRHRDAAEVSEQFDLPAPDIVRRWWMAGERRHAIEVARLHGAFAVAVERLERTDRREALELRREWASALGRSGDDLGAVEVLWAADELRGVAIALLREIELDDGPAGGSLLAYRLAAGPTESDTGRARELVCTADPSRRDELGAFVGTFVSEPAASKASDRSTATWLLRSSIRPDAIATLDHRARTILKGRIDPVLRADLVEAPAQETSSTHVELAQLPRALSTVSDAVALPSGRVLVAGGARGVRLLNRDGSTVATWGHPTDSLVPADHGGAVLLLRSAGTYVDVVRLELASRKLYPVGLLEVSSWADTCDGQTWLVLDDRGAASLDILASEPRIVFRPVEPESRVLSIARTGPAHASALVARGMETELRVWARGDRRLARRITVPPGLVRRIVQIAPGVVICGPGRRENGFRTIGEPTTTWSFVPQMVSGDFVAHGGSDELVIRRYRGGALRITGLEGSSTFRSALGRLTIWTEDGRIWIVDEATGAVTAIRA